MDQKDHDKKLCAVLVCEFLFLLLTLAIVIAWMYLGPRW